MEETVLLKLETYNEMLMDSVDLIYTQEELEETEKEVSMLERKLNALLEGMIKKDRLLDDYWVKEFTENPQNYVYLFFEIEIEYLLSVFSKDELIKYVFTKIGTKEQ